MVRGVWCVRTCLRLHWPSGPLGSQYGPAPEPGSDADPIRATLAALTSCRVSATLPQSGCSRLRLRSHRDVRRARMGVGFDAGSHGSAGSWWTTRSLSSACSTRCCCRSTAPASSPTASREPPYKFLPLQRAKMRQLLEGDIIGRETQPRPAVGLAASDLNLVPRFFVCILYVGEEKSVRRKNSAKVREMVTGALVRDS